MLNEKIIITNEQDPHEGNSSLTIIDIEYPYSVIPGKPNKANSYAQFKQINFIVKELLNNNYDAMVTLPISKNMLSEALPEFKGHTEYISALANTEGKEADDVGVQKT